jgi:hypothetical protein
MIDTILICLGLVLASAEHELDAPAWVWLFNISGVLCIAAVAWRTRHLSEEDR